MTGIHFMKWCTQVNSLSQLYRLRVNTLWCIRKYPRVIAWGFINGTPPYKLFYIIAKPYTLTDYSMETNTKHNMLIKTVWQRFTTLSENIDCVSQYTSFFWPSEKKKAEPVGYTRMLSQIWESECSCSWSVVITL